MVAMIRAGNGAKADTLTLAGASWGEDGSVVYGPPQRPLMEHTVRREGDQVLVDARILKWHYIGNVLGLHTQYELDRLTGRFSPCGRLCTYE